MKRLLLLISVIVIILGLLMAFIKTNTVHKIGVHPLEIPNQKPSVNLSNTGVNNQW